MFTGVGTALITPFDQDYNIDYSALKKIVNFQLEKDVDALIVLGTTGEAPVINKDERRKIIETVMEEVDGKTQVIVGTGTNDAKDVVMLNRIAEEFNVDGVLIVNPYYNKGTHSSIVQFYKYISERTTLPIILYNVPSRTGLNLLPETVVKIHSECTNIVGIKEASGNISQIALLFSIKPESLSVYSGNDDQTLSILALGGSGVISVFSNAFPLELKQITISFFGNDVIQAQKYHNKYLAMMNALFTETNPMPIKYVMNKLGFCKNILRLPLSPVSQNTEKILEGELDMYIKK